METFIFDNKFYFYFVIFLLLINKIFKTKQKYNFQILFLLGRLSFIEVPLKY